MIIRLTHWVYPAPWYGSRLAGVLSTVAIGGNADIGLDRQDVAFDPQRHSASVN
jgi:hypothetical protein